MAESFSTQKYDDVINMVHAIELQIKELTENQKHLSEKVERLADMFEKFIPESYKIERNVEINIELKNEVKELTKRINSLEQQNLRGTTILRFFGQWWKLPAAATVIAAIFEAAKYKFHF